MPASENPQLRHSTDESSLTPVSSVAGDVSASRDARISAVYIEPPPLPRAERVKYEAVSNRDLPQDFDYGLPLSDRVIIGEYRDNTTLWYYVENADGVAHRVSVLLIVSVPANGKLFLFLTYPAMPV
jgi:hypothetical protein